eukprot:CAMPEP_0183730328 /NCGR_PEP_ID=MMETSP0737-20130205/32561_1 /TAXON_ID=385413 /ORGANISM="Thalassiosira miniscula, Strain CCMP1093" /LENGTH=976 /DNA_ID=CAMNT_0025962787 /DNA_START=84 /DNA_END=3011 /DNA_ORIENTATION=+
MASTANNRPFKIISSREQKKQFDQAVKEVIRQRKLQQNGGRAAAGGRAAMPAAPALKLRDAVHSREFAAIKAQSQLPLGGGMHHGHPSSGRLNHGQPRRNSKALSNSLNSGSDGGAAMIAAAVRSNKHSSADDFRHHSQLTPQGGGNAHWQMAVAGVSQQRQQQQQLKQFKNARRATDSSGNKPKFLSKFPVRRSSDSLASDCSNELATELGKDRRGGFQHSASCRASLVSEKAAKVLGIEPSAKERSSSFDKEHQQPKSPKQFHDVNGLANRKINTVGGGNRRGRNALATSLNLGATGGVGDLLVADNDDQITRGHSEGGGDAFGSSRSLSEGLGDAFLVPTYRPARNRRDEEGLKKGTISNDDVSKNVRRISPTSSSDQMNMLANGLGGIKLEDLVPTRRTISRESSERSSEFMAQLQSNSPGEKIETVFKDGGMVEVRNKNPSTEQSNASKSQQVDELGRHDGGEEPQSNLKNSKPSATSLLSFATAQGSREPSPGDSNGGSYCTARESMGSVIVGEETLANKAGLASQDLEDLDCPRHQFEQMKATVKSNSGGTGRTQATSSSSMFSSRSSIGESNNPAESKTAADHSSKENMVAMVGSSETINFEVIKEEEKDHVDSTNERQVSGDAVKVQNSADGGVVDVDRNVSGFGKYKKRRSSHIKKIKKSIRRSLRGAASNNSSSNGDEYAAIGSGEGASQGGSTLSAEQTERVSQHFQRKGSSRSITSAFSSFSGMRSGDSTSSSRASNASGGLKWSRFRLRGGKHMSKAQSMKDINQSDSFRWNSDEGLRRRATDGSECPPGQRQIMVNTRQGSELSQMSNISSDDEFSNRSSVYTAGSRFTDFYDHNDHIQAVSTLISSRCTPVSTRALVSSLATVREPAHNEGGGREEQKHDEDYLQFLEVLSSNSNSNNNDNARRDSVSCSNRSENSASSYYRYPSHAHPLVHMRPSQLFPDSPGWQCDECERETFDSNIW